jgi:hypothetical protein
MRRFASALLCQLAACELQPPPPRKNAPPPAAPVPAPTPPSAGAGSGSAAPTFGAPAPSAGSAGSAADAATGSGSGSAAKPLIEVPKKCIDVGVHIATVLINSADPSQRSVFESERERIVRATGEVCTRQAWSDPAIACYMATSTQAQVKDCETKFTPTPRPTTTTPPPVQEIPAVPNKDGLVPEPIRGRG